MGTTCWECKYFNNDPAWLEKIFPGLNALSSAYGCARGEAGVCSKLDLYLYPQKKCEYFKPISSASSFNGSSVSTHDKSSEEL
jgi:hypothetical protein